jgi:MATE family multidrug resistance protein
MLAQAAPAQQSKLTSYPQGSLRELWHISFPLMISLMSVSFMLFLDRLFLAHYSLDAMNASVNAAMLSQLLQFWCLSTVSIAEVFVGQYNGSGQKAKLGEPIWQMVWLSIGTTFLFIPIGLFAGPYLFHRHQHVDLEVQYFKWLMYFAPISSLAGALAAFYIGRGKVLFVTLVIGLANILNIFLDVVLIFGVAPVIPSLGISGAAISTGIAQTFQSIVLFIAFFCSKNRQAHGTGCWRFNKKLFGSCLKIGIPNAIAQTLELMVWVFIFDMMTLLGSEYMTIVAVAQSILLLFTFMTDGLSRGATTIASNLIGSGQHDLVHKVLNSGIKSYGVIFFLLSSVLVIYPDPLLNWFLAGEAQSLSPTTRAALHVACFWGWLFFLFDGLSWLLVGLLTAAGDTRFIMKVSGIGPWLIAFLPTYLFVVRWGASADMTWMLVTIYAMVSCLLYLWRFRGDKWKSLSLIWQG